jgi:predicted nucleotidyltransferase
MSIQTEIGEKLKEIEKAENVRILHCVESGSRAWGFASPDSDYDVRFIYVHPKDWYLKLEKTRDVIEWQLDEVLDINGWDLKKMLTLLYSSNPTIFEWNNSPIVYKTTTEWALVSEVIDGYFRQKSGLYHYLSTAKSNYREYLKGDTVRLKKYFYVLRPILACRWILKKQTPPPMLFSELAAECLEEEMKEPVEKLLRLKTETPEIGEGKRIDAINEYIDRAIPELEEIIGALPDNGTGSWETLDKLFLSIAQ